MSKIPGFRSGKTWKKIIATLGYLLFLIIIAFYPAVTLRDKILVIVPLIFLFGIPFVLITNLGSIRSKLPLFKKGKLSYTVLGWTLSLIFTFVLVSAVAAATNNFHSEQYKEQARITEQDRQAKIIEQSKVDTQKKEQARIAEEQLQTTKNEQAKLEADKVATDKALTDAKAIEDKKAADAKAKVDAELKAKQDAADKVIADAKAVEDKKVADAAAYQTWIKGQFSVWDGSNTYLVDLVKENLNDAKSFEHVETKYADKGSFLTVKMTYRAKNAFGGVILQNVTANSDYKTDTIKITSQND